MEIKKKSKKNLTTIKETSLLRFLILVSSQHPFTSILLSFRALMASISLVATPPRCDCVPALITNDIFCKFVDGIGYVYRNGIVWVGTLDENGILIQKRCPFDYCLPHLTGVDLRYPVTQCAMNHAGTLCGGCKKGFSLALGTNMCLSCKENKHLALIIFFILAGLLLVVFIKVLNMTVSQLRDN